VDGLVNSAGIRGVGTILDIDRTLWQRNLAVNLDGTLNACQAFARAATEAGRQGAIVNVSSTAGSRAGRTVLPTSRPSMPSSALPGCRAGTRAAWYPRELHGARHDPDASYRQGTVALTSLSNRTSASFLT
jgi:NAD(P)-dependent dehydrogenase (short-subunit alcohol dehydrogenase family)